MVGSMNSTVQVPAVDTPYSALETSAGTRTNSYAAAFEECLNATSTKTSPWFVVPGDDKENASDRFQDRDGRPQRPEDVLSKDHGKARG